MTGSKEIKNEFLRLTADQCPLRAGVLAQQIGSLKFAKIKFDSADDALNIFLAKSIKFADNSIVIPCQVFNHHTQVARLRLSNLPFFRECFVRRLAEIWG
ncbi:hypothetical protein G6F57_010961 [Rhizopus arrhizus]|nr:hypothetical protein G6F22_011696 [Rhizopus arrhizus]KAG1400649.1 hypothetical protein G6F58_010908 [Rhizopus delemar]KAG0787376.1 hypothetical protein G6F21_007942 [Rhizopus arrhizus]KAG0805214.1 hypothetical protein G6F20_012088 [Rhizopus arrhizus]KAG0821604.1 hypothetical protein G6F18_012124 [Rhizopus arrhizus]